MLQIKLGCPPPLLRSFGEVLRADWDGMAVAVKILKQHDIMIDETSRKGFRVEAEFLQVRLSAMPQGREGRG